MKFCQIASASLFVLTSQALFVAHNYNKVLTGNVTSTNSTANATSVPNSTASATTIANSTAIGNSTTGVIDRRENYHDALDKRLDLTTLIPIIVAAITSALPGVLNTLLGLLGDLPSPIDPTEILNVSSSTNTTSNLDLVNEIVNQVKVKLPQAISEFEQNSQNAKRIGLDSIAQQLTENVKGVDFGHVGSIKGLDCDDLSSIQGLGSDIGDIL